MVEDIVEGGNVMGFFTRLIRELFRCLGHQNWIRHGIRYALINRFYAPDKNKSKNFEVGFYGFKYTGTLSSYIDWFVYFFGAYDRECLLLMRDVIAQEREAIFIDIGANVGHHSMFMSNYCRTVHSFEPYIAVRKRFEQSVADNKITNIVIHPVGLGVQDEDKEFYAPRGSNAGTGSFISTHEMDNNEAIGKLHIVNADEYILKLNLEHISLIKIDVEGYERFVLEGLQGVLRKFRPVVIMEFSYSTKDSFKDESDLRALLPTGYDLKEIVCNRPGFGVFNKARAVSKPFDFNKSGCNIALIPDTQTHRFV